MLKFNTILSLLNIRREERLVVFLLLAYSFCIGVGLYMYYTAATTLFLTKFNSIMLPIAYIVGGVFVHIVGRSNSYIQKYIKFSSLSIALVASLIISLAILLVAYNLTQSKWSVFLLFLWIRINLFVFGFTFWVSASRMFDLGQAKRLFSLIGMGEVVASIVANFLVKILISNKLVDVEDLLHISLFFIAVSLFFILIIIQKNKDKLSFKKVPLVAVQENKNLFKNKYYTFMYLLGILPIACLYLVEFNFSVSSKVIFPEKEQLAAFLGQYILICSIIELLVRGILFSFITKTYGIMSGLILLPISLIIVFVAVVLMTILNLKVFFLILLSRFLITSIRRSFSDTSYQLLYQPIPPKESVILQNKVETYAKPLGYIVAGGLLLGLASFHITETIYVFSLLFILLIIWAVVAFAMQKEYKKMLLAILSSAGGLLKPKQKATVQEESEQEINTLLTTPFDIITNLVESKDSADRIQAANYLAKSGRYFAFKYIIKLLEDRDEKVRLEAIKAASELKKPELFAYLFSNIVADNLKAETICTLLKIGEPIIDFSSNYFEKNSNKTEVLTSIIELVTNIGGSKAIRFLRSKLNYPIAEVSDRVVEGLNKLDYKANVSEESIVIADIDIKIEAYVWLLASENDIKDSLMSRSLLELLKRERKNVMYKLINLLTLLYGEQQFQQIKILFYDQKSQAKNYLSDLIGFLLSEEMKPKILPLFENVSDFEILLKYQQRYPQQFLSIEDRILAIINKDKASLLSWTKALAIKQLLQFNDEKAIAAFATNATVSNSVIAEVSLFGLAKLSMERFEAIRDYFIYSKNEKQHLIAEKAIRCQSVQDLLISKSEALFFSAIFDEMTTIDIIKNSSSLVNTPLKGDDYLNQDYLTSSRYAGFIVGSGEVAIILLDGTETSLTTFGHCWFSEKINQVKALETSNLYLIDFTLASYRSSQTALIVQEQL